MPTSKTINLVLEGGGVKGIALVGAIEVLESKGYKFNRIAGASAGAVVGGLLAAGYKASELKDIVGSMPYPEFKDEGFIDKFGTPGKAVSLLLEKGIYEGKFFIKWYGDLLAKKNVKTFGDLRLVGNSYPPERNYRFMAVAADITRGKLVFLPWELVNFDLSPDEETVAQSVRISTSIPFFYEPTKLGDNYLVDGGLLSNFPIAAFSDDKIPTIGIKLSAKPGAADRPNHITGPISYAKAVIKTALNAQDQIHLNLPKTISQTIFVDTSDVRATDFNISTSKQAELYASGQKAAEKYLSSHK